VWIIVTCEQGMRLEFPAGRMRQFMTMSGIKGRFEITFNDQQRLAGLRKIS